MVMETTVNIFVIVLHDVHFLLDADFDGTAESISSRRRVRRGWTGTVPCQAACRVCCAPLGDVPVGRVTCPIWRARARSRLLLSYC